MQMQQLNLTLNEFAKAIKIPPIMAGIFFVRNETKCGKLAKTSFGERGGASDKLRFFVKKSKQKTLLRRRVAGVKINGKR